LRLTMYSPMSISSASSSRLRLPLDLPRYPACILDPPEKDASLTRSLGLDDTALIFSRLAWECSSEMRLLSVREIMPSNHF